MRSASRWLVASWLLLVPACSEDAHLAPVMNLTRIGTTYDYPGRDHRLIVEVDDRGGGAIKLDGAVVDLPTLARALRQRADESRVATEPHESNVSLVLRLDRTLPFGVAQRILRTCAHPEVGIWKILFAVLPEAGGREGVVPTYLPRALEQAPPVPERIVEKVQLMARLGMREDGGGFFPATLYACIRKLLAEEPTLPCVIQVEPLVPVESVLAAVDAYLRAGAAWVLLEGPTDMPDARTATDLVREGKTTSGSPVIRWFGEELGADASATMPPAPPRRPASEIRVPDIDAWDRVLEGLPIIHGD